jgi:Tfp pilus assembly protein PilF
MKPPTAIFFNPIFITIIAVLFIAVSIFNFIAEEKKIRCLRDEAYILTTQREDINKEVRILSYELHSALQEIKDVRTEMICLEGELGAVKRQTNGMHSRLNNILKTQDTFASFRSAQGQALSTSKREKRIKVVGVGLPLIHGEESPRVEKELLKEEGSLERQSISEHFQRAVFYQKNGELSKAFQKYEGILKKDPLNAEVHNNMGLLYQQKGEYNKALLAYRKAVSLNPDYYKAHSNIGTVLYRQGRLDAADMEFEFILEKEPENVYALTNLAIIYKEKGELEEAKDLLLKAIELDKESHEAHYNLALILEELGRIDEAVIHYRAFLKHSHNTYTTLTADVFKHLEVIEKQMETTHKDYFDIH